MGKARRRWLLAIGAVLIVLLAVAAVVTYRWQMPRVRERLIAILSEELGSRVELADLQVTLGRKVRVSGAGLVLHHARETPGMPPFARVARFEIIAPVLAILRSPMHVESVRVERLEIFLPKRRADPSTAPPVEPASSLLAAAASQPSPAPTFADRVRGPSPVVIDTLTTTDTVLAIESSKPDRPPRTFLIHALTLTDAAFDRPVTFEAHLTNPKPVGAIRSTGRFGPWNADEPTLTPVAGDYRFERADLGTIKGIGGQLHSTGTFGGPLDQIDVEGTTETADFSLDIGGAPVPLATTYVALVDGTNGDTILKDVQATLGGTSITARGGVVHTPGREGRTVALEAAIDEGRLADVLRLAMDDPVPPMTGGLALRTTLDLPPGEDSVSQRLELRGDFAVTELRFASSLIQDKVDEFSRRGRGRPTDAGIGDVPSAMRGQFHLKDGALRFTGLRFAVRGAVVQLNGRYLLRGGALDFRGTLRLQARASQTMTGWKRWVAKAIDPLLARDGAGTVLPIRVTGTAKQPKFGVEVRKIF
jgi:hypothetical protein